MSDAQTTLEKFRAVIVVAQITPPSGRGKSARIDTEDGNTLWVWPDKLGLIREGEQYEVEGNIRADYHNITTVRHLGPYRPPKQQPPATASAPPLQPKNGKKMDYYKPRDPDEQRQIWVCAMLGREIDMGRGLMTEEALLARGKIHAAVWEKLFGADAAGELVREVYGGGDERSAG